MLDKPAPSSRTAPLSLAAFACGILSVLLFFVGGGIFDQWTVGALAGAVAVVLGFVGRGREPAGRRYALIGLILGGIVVAWFVVYIILALAGVVTDS